MQKQLAKIIKQDATKSHSLIGLNVNNFSFTSIGIIAVGIIFHAIFIWIIARKH